LLLAPDLAGRRVEDPVYDEARDLHAGDRLLPDYLREVEGRADRVARGVLAADDLYPRPHGGRKEEVEADHLAGTKRLAPHLGDRERGGVGGEDRVTGRHLVELLVDRLLDLHPL